MYAANFEKRSPASLENTEDLKMSLIELGVFYPIKLGTANGEFGDINLTYIL